MHDSRDGRTPLSRFSAFLPRRQPSSLLPTTTFVTSMSVRTAVAQAPVIARRALKASSSNSVASSSKASSSTPSGRSYGSVAGPRRPARVQTAPQHARPSSQKVRSLSVAAVIASKALGRGKALGFR